ncbi:MAG: ABC transporter, permease protein 1 (cluster 1, maltose/g3p/polyamine/iron) [uncultured Arthrobacter sp.]|uniref:ABC transporter, permease protein 1 (Cluster 1, maltose/g3p/polyamine/iron) n=1 Tax=uncultured Arthrobacter sp. TaxID=114050 RepID=A0A6J4ICS3_9MICC|nr:sugar ABC transporter permease [uncultured Arthrobacter sp.]CAA9246584.1 MAG: ABC transporter, permease protein 1 (cluster 1, maltose/g3p/polyamine/iron) [uncultured Arthrobacter sp.]
MTATALPAPRTGVEVDDRAATAGKPPRPENRAGWLFAAPFLVLYVAFLIGPVLVGLVISLFNTTTVKSGIGSWVGFSNYADVLTNADFWASMWHSALFTLLTTPILVLLPLLFAILVSRLGRGQWFYRLAFFAPYVVPSAAVALIFAFMYTPQTGLITNAFGWFGLTAPDFFGSTSGAWFAVVLLTVWWTFGFNFILYTAAIQEISEEIYEAATLDGAGPWQQIRTITAPLLRPTIGLVLILQVLASLKVFDQIYILLAGGPNYTTRPVIQYIFDSGFSAYRGGYAAAATMVYFAVLVLVSVAWFLVRRRNNSANA